ncbi:hypothetical protein ACWC4D_41575 [Streptomyces sp. NPDC001288]
MIARAAIALLTAGACFLVAVGAWWAAAGLAGAAVVTAAFHAHRNSA